VLGSHDARYTCRSSRGSESGLLFALGQERVAVGGRSFNALKVRTVGRVKGGDSGTEVTDWYLGAKGLPLRIAFTSRTSRPLKLGRAHYRERADLRLVSMTPRS
jgi:hypothetical protein